MSISYADIEYGTEENEMGYETPCVYARCHESEYCCGPIWGDGPESVKRALATLTEECECGATFHKEETDE